MSTFRRPLLGLLNHLWEFIRRFEETSVRWMPVPRKVSDEIHTFLSLLPLARIDFRLSFCELVTCSDASNTGGGICVSTGLSERGKQAATLPTLSELRVTAKPQAAVLGIGVNDGIGTLRVALDLSGTNAAGYISIEPDSACRRVVESHYGATIFHESAASVDASLVREWACKFPSVSMVIAGAGPSSCLQSQLGLRDRLVLHDIVSLVRVAFPWASVHCFLEGLSSMKTHARARLTQMMGVIPFEIDAFPLAPCRRKRLFWVDWPLRVHDGLAIFQPVHVSDLACGTVEFQGDFRSETCLERGCTVSPDFVSFPTFTVPNPQADHLAHTFAWSCGAQAARQRWAEDGCRFPPHQYESRHCVITPQGSLRLPSVLERERMMGLPDHYTLQALNKTLRKSEPVHLENTRLSMLGSMGSLPVVAVLLMFLLSPESLCDVSSFQELKSRLYRQSCSSLQRFLLTPSCVPRPDEPISSLHLIRRICSFLSTRGSDVLLCAPSAHRSLCIVSNGPCLLTCGSGVKFVAGFGERVPTVNT